MALPAALIQVGTGFDIALGMQFHGCFGLLESCPSKDAQAQINRGAVYCLDIPEDFEDKNWKMQVSHYYLIHHFHYGLIKPFKQLFYN